MDKELLDKLPEYQKIYNKIARVFIDEGVVPRDALIILTMMGESMYKLMVDDSEYFMSSSIETIMGVEEETK